MTAPIKTCDYCGATGEMPTFMNGETICYTCMYVLPKTLPEARQELMRLRAVLAVVAQPVPSVPEGFSREDLEAVADGLDGYEKTVNVGNVTGGGDDHLESTTAYAARFIRAMLAAPEAKL